MVDRPTGGGPGRLGGGLNAAVIIVAVVLAAVLINATFSQIHWRADLTSEKIYTLSPATHQILADLDDPVEVRAFFSPNLPPPYHNLERQVEELLAEYRAASNSKLDYRIIIAADDDEEATESARGYGIDKSTIGQQTATELSYRKVFKGVAFVQGDRAESVGDLRVSGRPELDNFEYEFSRALLNLTRPEPRRVGLVTGAGGPAHDGRVVDSVQSVFTEALGGLLAVEPINIRENPIIPEEYSALIFWNITEDLGDEALQALEAFVARGGNLGWFQSGGVISQ